MENYADKRAELDNELIALNERRKKLADERRLITARMNRLTSARLDSLTDEEIMGSWEIREWLVREANTHGAAYRRMHNLADNGALRVSGIDARPEVIDRNMPALQIAITSEHVAFEVAAQIRKWCEIWRRCGDHVISVLESTCSASGSYNIYYAPDSEPEAVLSRLTYGRDRTITRGTLEDVVAYVAINHRMDSPMDDDEDDPYDWSNN
jgi:hypothetical protein